MSKKKSRLLKCNNKKYLQYYNIYIDNNTILLNNFRYIQSKYNYSEHINLDHVKSKIKKSIIKGTSIKNSKKIF